MSAADVRPSKTVTGPCAASVLTVTTWPATVRGDRGTDLADDARLDADAGWATGGCRGGVSVDGDQSDPPAAGQGRAGTVAPVSSRGRAACLTRCGDQCPRFWRGSEGEAVGGRPVQGASGCVVVVPPPLWSRRRQATRGAGGGGRRSAASAMCKGGVGLALLVVPQCSPGRRRHDRRSSAQALGDWAGLAVSREVPGGQTGNGSCLNRG